MRIALATWGTRQQSASVGVPPMQGAAHHRTEDGAAAADARRPAHAGPAVAGRVEGRTQRIGADLRAADAKADANRRRFMKGA
jgi:hypothetical protein